MTIYPLPPSELDDKTLSQQIKAIAQVLCNVHHCELEEYFDTITDDVRCPEDSEIYQEELKKIPLSCKICTLQEKKFIQYARTCRANYLKLVEMGLRTCEEYNYRYGLNVEHKLFKVILWARDNVPIFDFDKILDNFVNIGNDIAGLLSEQTTSFPLVMPSKYQILKEIDYETLELDTIESYRNYYRAKYERSLKGSQSVSMFGIPYYSESKNNFKWTRRQKPNWLEI